MAPRMLTNVASAMRSDRSGRGLRGVPARTRPANLTFTSWNQIKLVDDADLFPLVLLAIAGTMALLPLGICGTYGGNILTPF